LIVPAALYPHPELFRTKRGVGDKKTTWVLIGLSFCVLVLATALGMVLIQNQAEKAGPQIPESGASDRISSEVQQMFGSFSIAPLRLPERGVLFAGIKRGTGNPESGSGSL
jgi:hypothetical protein